MSLWINNEVQFAIGNFHKPKLVDSRVIVDHNEVQFAIGNFHKPKLVDSRVIVDQQ